MKRLSLVLASLLILTYLWAATPPDYPLIVRDKDGHSVVDLKDSGADLEGNLVAKDLTLDTLTVTNSVSLPVSGTVPTHPIENSHNTVATGANLDSLVGGDDLPSTLHYHGTAPSGFTVEGAALNAKMGVTVEGGVLTSTYGAEATAESSLLGRFAEHGSVQMADTLYYDCNQNSAISQTVFDANSHWNATITDGTNRVNTSVVSTTDAVAGTAFNLGGLYELTTPINYNSAVPSNMMSIIGNSSYFTISFWHKAEAAGLGVSEYIIYGTNISMAITAAGAYSVTVGGASLSDSDNHYGAGWQHIAIVRSSATYVLYVNGRRCSTGSGTSGGISGTLSFGGTSAVQRGRGIYDEIRFYRWVMGQNQIQAVYNDGGTAPTTRFMNTINLGDSPTFTNVTVSGRTLENAGKHAFAQMEQAHYNFNETGTSMFARDEVDHFNTMIVSYPATPQVKYTVNSMTYSPGKVGAACFAFDATKYAYLQPFQYTRRVGQDFSQAFWVYCNDDEQYGYYVGYGPNVQMRSFTNGANNYIGVYVYDSLSASQSAVLSTTIGVWTHIVVLKRGSKMEVYRDGALVSTLTSASGTYDYNGTPQNVTVGGITSRSNCRVDDWRFYQFALSPAQVAAIYNGGSGTEAPLETLSHVGGALNLPSRSGYVAEVRNVGNSTAYKGIKVLAGENTATANNEMIGCYEGDGDQRGALVIDSSRNVAIWNVSDRLAKTSISPTASKIASLKAAKVYDFAYKTGGTSRGFMAQELEVAVPAATAELEVDEIQNTSTTLGTVLSSNGTTITLTTGEKIPGSGVKIEGQLAVRYGKKVAKVRRKGVLTTELLPVLWKVVQEQQVQIESLETRVRTLEKKVNP